MNFGGGRRLAALGAITVASSVLGIATVTLAGFATQLAGVAIHRPSDFLAKGGMSVLLVSLTEPGPVLAAWVKSAGVVVDWLMEGNLESNAALAVTCAVSVAPALLVAPVFRPSKPGTEGWSLRASVAGAAILGGGLALCIVACIGDLVSLATGDNGTAEFFVRPWVSLPAWTVLGAAWAFLLARAGRSRTPDRIDRFVRWLFAGTCVELAIAAPTYALGMRKDDCHCGWSSWWAICGGTAALVLLCGPMLILLATRRARMQWMRSACPACGYPRRSGGGACAECGTPFAAPGTAQ